MQRLLPRAIVRAAAAATLLLSACATRPAAVDAAPTRVVTWNVLRGFLDRTQVAPAQRWLKEQAPDVVALQEVNGFTAARLAEVAAAWGHGHAVMAKESGYPVALTSRHPIEVVERRLEGMHHGYLHARTAGLDVVVVHLHPGDWRFRRREVAVLAPLVRRLVDEGRDVVVLGDFNAHHPLDCAHLDGQRALLARRATGKNLIAERTFDYGVLARFEAAGVTDAAYHHLGEVAARSGTFPTQLLEHAGTEASQAGFLERIDFVLLSPAAAARAQRVAMPRGGALDEVSDHYPVVVDLAPRQVTTTVNGSAKP
ncbi:MAG: endonuclease/exonuclease/phosphatase family protein [Planctomycetota bacterium]|nr:endonuclease/exonuclease/phosphatase family protein [Planctomycetota bacterium]